MKKIRTLLRAPVEVQSGYSVHSRQIFQALIDDPLFDLHVESINWGHCSYMTEEYPLKKKIKECIHKYVLAKHQNNMNWDLYITVTIPNEFKKEGKFNIGVTAGIESDRISHVWVQKCNEMDLVVVPSEHSRKVVCDTKIDWLNQQTGEKGTFQVVKPVMVCSEGVDTEIFKSFDFCETNEPFLKKFDFESDFNFLHVGQWSKGNYGEDRKNIANLVKFFIEEFKGQKDVGLVLKINMARNSIVDYGHVSRRLNEIKSNFEGEEIPPIYLLHGNLTDQEMSELYNHPKIKAFISLTHGEGYGLPLIEAAACGLPVIATNWSGHLDFLNKGKFSAVKYDLVDIPECAVWDPIMIKGSKWAQVQEEDAKHRMSKMVSAHSKPQEWATDLAEKIKEEFDVSVTNQGFLDVVKMALQQEVAAPKIDPLEHLQSFIDTPDDYNVIYTMPMSAGDVFISTAVINGLRKSLVDGAKIYFATNPKYADILKNNPDIYKIIPWNETMMNVELLEEVFDLALLPNTATQYNFSNYTRRGQGRLLAEEYANHCICELGDYHIDDSGEDFGPGGSFITVHPTSGQGQWEARNYIEWQETVDNLKRLYPELVIVQVGSEDEPKLDNVDFDYRGKTNVHELAGLIGASELHLTVDTFTMHLAAALNTPVVALFGSSYAQSSGPWTKDKENSKIILLEAEQRLGCNRACYKYQCKKNKEMPCINEIDPAQVVESCAAMLDVKFEGKFERTENFKYERIYGKISGYTTTYNLKGYPFVESIKSMLGFCDEVVVLDGCSDDGTYEILEELAKEDEKIKIYQNPWDFEEPGVDGLQKAFARAMCENEFLWQQDCDEVVHEDDYEKIKMITKRFPNNVDILHLPVVEIWGNSQYVTGRRHAWKWRMSRNKPEITHGINREARLTNEETGKVYAKPGASDGCEYVNTMTYEALPHTGFYNTNVDMARMHMPEIYDDGINEVFENIPSVFHYSWCSLENKIKNFQDKWNKQWNILYQTDNVERFAEAQTDEQVKELAQKLFDQGGEDSDQVKYKFKLKRSNPAIMQEWLSKAPLNDESGKDK